MLYSCVTPTAWFNGLTWQKFTSYHTKTDSWIPEWQAVFLLVALPCMATGSIYIKWETVEKAHLLLIPLAQKWSHHFYSHCIGEWPPFVVRKLENRVSSKAKQPLLGDIFPSGKNMELWKAAKCLLNTYLQPPSILPYTEHALPFIRRVSPRSRISRSLVVLSSLDETPHCLDS